jgi:hypothetical protein
VLLVLVWHRVSCRVLYQVLLKPLVLLEALEVRVLVLCLLVILLVCHRLRPE